MTIPRCFLQITKQYAWKHNLLQSNIKQTYCGIHLNYSSKPPRLYTDRHEWIVVDKDIGTVGISKYAQESLGDVVYAQLPDPDTKVKDGDEVGALESVKAASEIYSPVTGVIIEKNTAVEAKPTLINTDYYDKGWLFKLKLTNLSEIKNLMTEEAYEKFLKTDVLKGDSDTY